MNATATFARRSIPQAHLMSAYSGDHRLDRGQLARLETPAGLGRFHQPVPFADYVETVEDQLGKLGLSILAEEHLVGHQGQRYFGALTIGSPDTRIDVDTGEPLEGELIRAEDWHLFLALRGSHDQSVPRGIALGRRVMVCSNLCFSGDIAQISTKQTTNIWNRLPGMVYEACTRIPELAVVEAKRVERLKDFTMKRSWGDAALVEIHRRGGLTAAQLGRAIAEWTEPSYPEFAADMNAWRVEQAVTEAIKPARHDQGGASVVGSGNLSTVTQRTQVASKFLNEMVGFTI